MSSIALSEVGGGETYEELADLELEIRDQFTVDVSGTMSDGSAADLSDATISFRSTNTNVIEVDDNNLITVVGDGVAKLEVTADLDPVSRSTEIFVVAVNFKEDVILDAGWSDPNEIVSKIGHPAVLNQGAAFSSLQVEAYTDVDVSGQLLYDAGNAIAQISAQLDQGEHEISIPGNAGSEGTYKLELTLNPAGQAPMNDAFSFTVSNSIASNETTAVYLGADGKLHYVPDYKGNHILDFSKVTKAGACRFQICSLEYLWK